MKKHVYSILAVVLILAILASSFVMIGVSAEDSATEKITIGSNEYEIYTDKKFVAYDSYAAAVENLTPDATAEGENNAFNQGPDVKFANTDWSMEGRQLWGGTTLQTPIYIKTDEPYTQIAFYNQAVSFGCYSVSLYNNGLHVNPSHPWLGADEIYALKLNYTAKEAGNVVIYDKVGIVSASTGPNATPFWDWLSDNVGKDWVTYSIYKNDTLLWPKNGEDNKFEAGGEQIEFPDLGAITVNVGDVITVKVEGYSARAGIDINPVIAYTTADANEELGGGSTDAVQSEEITIGNNKYLINPNEKSNARDVITNALKNNAFDVNTNVTLSNTAWAVEAQYADWGKDTNFVYYQKSNLSKLVFESWLADNWAHEIVIQDNGLVINPGDNANSAYISLSYIAPKEGEVVIYDVAGSFTALKDSDPYWAWWDGSGREMTVTVYKNDTVIWPTANENNKIKLDATTLAFPDLGKIEVAMGDVITVKFDSNNGFTHTLTDLEVAYIYEEPSAENQVVVGDSTYTILPEYKYNAYDEFSKLAAKYDPANKTTVKFAGKWSIDARYTSDDEFGKDPWGSEFGWKYEQLRKGTEAYGFRSAQWMAGDDWFGSSVCLDTNKNKHIVFAHFLWPDTSIESKAKSTIRLVFTADRPGSVILYDEFGILDGSGLADEPYWANEAAANTTSVEIYKNGTKIWPKNNEANVVGLNTQTIEFPDLGEINVKAGDKIAVNYTSATISGRTGVSGSLNVAYTKVTGPAQTDANFGTEVIVLVSVIAVLGAVVIAAGFISKKRDFNN